MFMARAGMTIRAGTGYEALGGLDRMSTILFYEASPGDKLQLLDRRYLFNVATYSPIVDDKYIYTYSYKPDQSWVMYNNDLSGDTYRVDDYVFTAYCYFRLCFKRKDGRDFDTDESDRVNEIIALSRLDAENPESKIRNSGLRNSLRIQDNFLISECESLVQKIEQKRTEGSLLFALLSDTHYTVNGTWNDTLASLRAVHENAGFDGIIHLGDMTDGIVTAAATRHYVGEIINDISTLRTILTTQKQKSFSTDSEVSSENQVSPISVPLYISIGNHDTNYFKNNPEPFTIGEQCDLYLSHSDSYTVRNPFQPWYYKDFPEHCLRFVFLHSFDYTQERRYGFSADCLRWLEETLAGTPDAYNILVFSHLTPLVKLQHWTDYIRRGDELALLLDGYNAEPHKGNILAYINGHNHADQIYRGLSFPIVSVGCGKTEFFTDYKPKGAYTPPRKLGEASQELWDALIITPREKRLDFIRFGAGNDRTVLF